MCRKLGFVLVLLVLTLFVKADAQQSPIIPQSLSFPFGNSVEWKVTSGGGYDNGDYHAGGDLYALDFQREDGLTEGEIVYAPTDAFFVHQHSSTPDCIDLAIGDYDQNNWVYLQMCHLDLESYIARDQYQANVVQKGEVIGRISSSICGPAGRCPIPHVHMAAFIGRKENPALGAKVGLAYTVTTFDLRLDGHNFSPVPAEENKWRNESDLLSSNPVAGMCSIPPELEEPTQPVTYVESLTVYTNVCSYTYHDIEGDPPSPTPGPTNTPVPQYGDSHVDIREDTNYQSGQYGWDNPTGGWFNVPDYMDNKTSSIQIDSGWSIMVAKDQNGGGAKKCFVTSYADLSSAYYDHGDPITDTISSVWVYHDSTCGGQYLGLEPGDTVTIWIDPTYWGTRYGWHDSGWIGNVPDYVNNQTTSVGVMPGWSVMLYENQNQGGGYACFTSSDPDLQNNWFNNGAWVNDNVESVHIYHDSNCGGWLVAPTYSMQVNILDQATGWAELVFTWSNAQESWQVCTFGDGGEVGYFGQSGTSVGHANGNNHDYNPGTYTATCTIVGRDGVNYQATQQVIYTAPQPPTLSLTATVTDPIHGLVETNATWSGAREDWQVLNWGDGAETGYFGASGTNVGHANGYTHYFQPGTYNLVFTVKGLDGQNYTATQIVTINPPSYSLTATVTEPNTGLVTTEAIWSNAENDWQILQWGDGTETGYQGSSGTNVGHANGNTHYYQPGTYTLTFNVKGGNGTIYPVTQQVTIDPPTYALAVVSVDNSTLTVTTDADWSNADNAWQVLNWGDGSETGYFGPQGTNVGHENGNSHQYATSGTYTLTFTVHGAGGSVYTTTQQVTVGS